MSSAIKAVRNVWRSFYYMSSREIDIPKMKRIGTHSGCFHCDEALACFMLKQLPEYKDAEIIRTRDKEVLDTCDIVVDVGGEYVPEKHRYDHHQKSFNETLSSVRPDLVKNKKIKLSSAGLIYAHFGMEVIIEILSSRNISYEKSDLLLTYDALYDGLIEEIDAIDNGVPMCPEGISPVYTISTHLGSRVHRLNPEWNSTEKTSLDELFQKAVSLVGTEFLDKLLRIATVWLPARNIVKEAIENRGKVHSSGQVLELGHCPWKYHLMDLERIFDIENEIKFVIFEDKSSKTWRVQAVPVAPESFICRIFLHKDWRGVRDEDLSKISGVDGCVFCHSTGFIGGNKTREGALQMAIKSIKKAQEEAING